MASCTEPNLTADPAKQRAFKSSAGNLLTPAVSSPQNDSRRGKLQRVIAMRGSLQLGDDWQKMRQLETLKTSCIE